MAAAKQHHSSTLPFSARAALPSCPPLNAYLLHLMAIKRTNLCLSADVTTTSELLNLANELGDSICLLKTHADIISDFSDRTVTQLREIANRKHFLIFEDRKFADIGSTVQKQYSAGPLSIAKWAELVTVHVLPGPAIVTALKQAASHAISSYNTSVHTEVSGGHAEDDEDLSEHLPELSGSRADVLRKESRSSEPGSNGQDSDFLGISKDYRKHSVVSVSTTISSKSEPMSPQPTKPMFGSISGSSDGRSDQQDQYAQLGPIPYLRSCLLLAQMSSEDHLMTQAYTQKCVEIGRQNRDFVLGFISQTSLNASSEDNFLTLAPGVKFTEENESKGDGLGQQYRTPKDVIQNDGIDIIIVGRGILAAKDRAATAQRYRDEAWNAYEARVQAR